MGIGPARLERGSGRFQGFGAFRGDGRANGDPRLKALEARGMNQGTRNYISLQGHSRGEEHEMFLPDPKMPSLQLMFNIFYSRKCPRL